MDSRSSYDAADRSEQDADDISQAVPSQGMSHTKADKDLTRSLSRRESRRSIQPERTIQDTESSQIEATEDPIDTKYPWSLIVVGKRQQAGEEAFQNEKFVSIGIDDTSCRVVSGAIDVSLRRVRNEITGYEDKQLHLPPGRDHIFLLRTQTEEPVPRDLTTFYPGSDVARAACGLPRGIAIDKIGFPLKTGDSYIFGPEDVSLVFRSTKTSSGTPRITARSKQSSQELLPAYRWMPLEDVQQYSTPTIVWVGELNGDDIPDFILKHSIYAEYSVGDFSLFVSSNQDSSTIFREMARTRTKVM